MPITFTAIPREIAFADGEVMDLEYRFDLWVGSYSVGARELDGIEYVNENLRNFINLFKAPQSIDDLKAKYFAALQGLKQQAELNRAMQDIGAVGFSVADLQRRVEDVKEYAQISKDIEKLGKGINELEARNTFGLSLINDHEEGIVEEVADSAELVGWDELLAQAKALDVADGKDRERALDDFAYAWQLQQDVAHLSSEDVLSTYAIAVQVESNIKEVRDNFPTLSSNMNDADEIIVRSLEKNLTKLKEVQAQLLQSMLLRIQEAAFFKDFYRDNLFRYREKFISHILRSDTFVLPDSLKTLDSADLFRANAKTHKKFVDIVSRFGDKIQKEELNKLTWLAEEEDNPFLFVQRVERKGRLTEILDPAVVGHADSVLVLPLEVAEHMPHSFLYGDNRWCLDFFKEQRGLLSSLNGCVVQFEHLTQSLEMGAEAIKLENLTRTSGFLAADQLLSQIAAERQRIAKHKPSWFTGVLFGWVPFLGRGRSYTALTAWEQKLIEVEKVYTDAVKDIIVKLLDGLAEELFADIKTGNFLLPNATLETLVNFIRKYGTEVDKAKLSKLTEPMHLFTQFEFAQQAEDGLGKRIDKKACYTFKKFCEKYFSVEKAAVFNKLIDLVSQEHYPDSLAEDQALLDEVAGLFSGMTKQKEVAHRFLVEKIIKPYILPYANKYNEQTYGFVKRMYPNGVRVWDAQRESSANQRLLCLNKVLNCKAGMELDFSYNRRIEGLDVNAVSLPILVAVLKKEDKTHNKKYITTLLQEAQNYVNASYNGNNANYFGLLLLLSDDSAQANRVIQDYVAKRFAYLCNNQQEAGPLLSIDSTYFSKVKASSHLSRILKDIIKENYTGNNTYIAEVVNAYADETVYISYMQQRLQWLLENNQSIEPAEANELGRLIAKVNLNTGLIETLRMYYKGEPAFVTALLDKLEPEQAGQLYKRRFKRILQQEVDIVQADLTLLMKQDNPEFVKFFTEAVDEAFTGDLTDDLYAAIKLLPEQAQLAIVRSRIQVLLNDARLSLHSKDLQLLTSIKYSLQEDVKIDSLIMQKLTELFNKAASNTELNAKEKLFAQSSKLFDLVELCAGQKTKEQYRAYRIGVLVKAKNILLFDRLVANIKNGQDEDELFITESGVASVEQVFHAELDKMSKVGDWDPVVSYMLNQLTDLDVELSDRERLVWFYALLNNYSRFNSLVEGDLAYRMHARNLAQLTGNDDLSLFFGRYTKQFAEMLLVFLTSADAVMSSEVREFIAKVLNNEYFADKLIYVEKFNTAVKLCSIKDKVSDKRLVEAKQELSKLLEEVAKIAKARRLSEEAEVSGFSGDKLDTVNQALASLDDFLYEQYRQTLLDPGVVDADTYIEGFKGLLKVLKYKPATLKKYTQLEENYQQISKQYYGLVKQLDLGRWPYYDLSIDNAKAFLKNVSKHDRLMLADIIQDNVSKNAAIYPKEAVAALSNFQAVLCEQIKPDSKEFAGINADYVARQSAYKTNLPLYIEELYRSMLAGKELRDLAIFRVAERRLYQKELLYFICNDEGLGLEKAALLTALLKGKINSFYLEDEVPASAEEASGAADAIRTIDDEKSLLREYVALAVLSKTILTNRALAKGSSKAAADFAASINELEVAKDRRLEHANASVVRSLTFLLDFEPGAHAGEIKINQQDLFRNIFYLYCFGEKKQRIELQNKFEQLLRNYSKILAVNPIRYSQLSYVMLLRKLLLSCGTSEQKAAVHSFGDISKLQVTVKAFEAQAAAEKTTVVDELSSTEADEILDLDIMRRKEAILRNLNAYMQDFNSYVTNYYKEKFGLNDHFDLFLLSLRDGLLSSRELGRAAHARVFAGKDGKDYRKVIRDDLNSSVFHEVDTGKKAQESNAIKLLIAASLAAKLRRLYSKYERKFNQANPKAELDAFDMLEVKAELERVYAELSSEYKKELSSVFKSSDFMTGLQVKLEDALLYSVDKPGKEEFKGKS